MNRRMSWSDFATVLLIAESGSLAAAARNANESRPTLMRRLNLIEHRLGTRIFDRFRTGYVPTSAGQDLIDAARQIRQVAAQAEQRVGDRDQRLSGTVTLTTTDTLYSSLLAPELSGLRTALPEIVLDIHVSNRVQDLFHREADIALRPATAPQDDLVGRKLGIIRQAIYVSREHEQQHLEDLPAVGPTERMPYADLHEAMRTTGLSHRCSVRLNSIQAIHQAVRAGVGAGILPVYLGDADPELVRRGEPIPALDTELWLLTDPAIRNIARVRAVLDYTATRSSLRSKLP